MSYPRGKCLWEYVQRGKCSGATYPGGNVRMSLISTLGSAFLLTTVDLLIDETISFRFKLDSFYFKLIYNDNVQTCITLIFQCRGYSHLGPFVEDFSYVGTRMVSRIRKFSGQTAQV